jgi:hypothetical protein
MMSQKIFLIVKLINAENSLFKAELISAYSVYMTMIIVLTYETTVQTY